MAWTDEIDVRVARGADRGLRERLAAAEPEAGVAVRPAAWAELWPFGAPRERITRDDVAAVAQQRDWTALLRAVSIWGHGTIGYGPFRLNRVLAQPELDARLEGAVALLEADDDPVLAAYTAMERGPCRIPGFGPAFFTRFLSYAQQEVRPGEAPRALVLDRLVGRTLVEATAAVLEEGGVALPEDLEPWAAAVRLWRDPWAPRRYGVYLDWAAATATRAGWSLQEVETAATALGRTLLRPTGVSA